MVKVTQNGEVVDIESIELPDMIIKLIFSIIN